MGKQFMNIFLGIQKNFLSLTHPFSVFIRYNDKR